MTRKIAPTCSALDEAGSISVQEHLVDGETVFPPAGEPTLWSYASPVVAEVFIGEHRSPRRVYHPGDLRLTRPGVQVVRVPDEPSTIRSLTLPQRLFEQVLGASAARSCDLFGALQARPFHSPVIETILDRLQAADHDPNPLDRTYFETLTQSIVMELWRLSGGAGLESAQTPGALSAEKMRRVDRFIDTHLGDKIELRDLAKVAELPCSNFQRMFKDATGQTPFQHVQARRLQNARHQIERTSLSLGEIAFLNGFASQSHMTDVFKAKLGATPGALRRAAV